MKVGKHSARDLECLFAACSVRLLFYTGLLARGILRLTGRYCFGTLMRDFAYAGAREVFRKVEKQTLH